MMRWIWRLQSDRGGQHAEAGVLMAALIVLAGAVTVGSVPQVSTAVADQWVCHISDRGSQRCGGGTEALSAPTAPERAPVAGYRAAEPAKGTAVTAAAATPPEDPARSHFPRVPKNSGGGGVWEVPGGEAPMDSCTHEQSAYNCVGGAGGYHECSIKVRIDAEGGFAFVKSCSRTITPKTPLTCGDEGLSPGWDTCTGREGVILHCTDADAVGDRLCTDTDHDADAATSDMASCGGQNGYRPVSSVVCMGDNGTLYETVCRWTDTEPRACQKDRGISASSPSLSGCQADPSDATGVVVQCTYTPVVCDPLPSSGSSCADQTVSVRCLLVGGRYQQCQSLGLLVPEGDTVKTACLDVVDRTFCRNSDSYLVAPPVADEDAVTTAVGEVDIAIAPGETFDVPTTDQGTLSLTLDELTALCTTEPATCDDMVDSTIGAGATEAEAMLRDQGICTDDCDAFLDMATESLDAGDMTSDGVTITLSYATIAVSSFVVGGLVIGGVDQRILGSTIIAGGVMATILEMRKSLPPGAGARAKAAVIAAGSRLLAPLRTGLTSLATMWRAQFAAHPEMTDAQRRRAANRVFEEIAAAMAAMEDGRVV